MIIFFVLLLFVICAVLFAVGWHDIHSFKIRKYTITTDKISGEFKIAFLSDLHGYEFGKGNEKLINAINEISPDAVMSAGDMFSAGDVDGKYGMKHGFDLLTELSKKYRVYIANGNHEYKIKSFTKEYGNAFDRYRNRLKRAGIIYLENETAVIKGRNIAVTGLDLDLEYFRKLRKKPMETDYLQRLIGENSRNDGIFRILLAHNPVYFKEYAKWGADLSLSGHVHGGIVRLPFIGGVISPAITLFPRYDGGEYHIGNKTMILSRGLGTHTIHVRLFNPCELDVITIIGRK